jgi:hypothetical protein
MASTPYDNMPNKEFVITFRPHENSKLYNPNSTKGTKSITTISNAKEALLRRSKKSFFDEKKNSKS